MNNTFTIQSCFKDIVYINLPCTILTKTRDEKHFNIFIDGIQNNGGKKLYLLPVEMLTHKQTMF